MASRRTVELFYDVISPYSWIGFELLLHYQPIWKINLNLQPFLLAGVMKETGNSPPGLIPAKGKYMTRDLQRLCKFYNLDPIHIPSDPVNVLMVKGSLPAMRLVTAAKMSHSDKVQSLSREMWKRVYRRDEDIASQDSLLEACKKVGLNVAESEKLLEESKTDSVKEKLKEITQRAIEYGSFGAPTIVVDDAKGKKEMFFGNDSLPMIAHLLGVELHKGPLDLSQKSKL